ncbi:hypothetical protein GWK47_043911 [Chionoecetes opilio]|uniref:Uncharacterized protein n=1 Tax=Chionoecetes opilio TaxID=41210 RepID=A0A8J5CYE8_CHIOP|nr:hypothetical protein GWK47_043911 [Chionoecetes opilio]
MDNSMQRGGRMMGLNRPQHNDWRFGDSRGFKDAQMQGTSRQHGDSRMQDSRPSLESRMEPNYSSHRMSDASRMAGNARLPERARGGPQPQREVRAYPESRMPPGSRLQGNSRMHEDLPVHDQLRSRSDVVAYDYNHRRSGEHSPLKDAGGQSDFIMNVNENMRSGRLGYNVQDNVRPGFADILPGLSSDGLMKNTLDLMSAKSYGPSAGFPPGSGHILTPSLTSSSGPLTVDDIRSAGNRGSFPKEKISKAFDYLKNWKLKMNMPTDAFLLEKVGTPQPGHDVMPPQTHDDWYTQPPTAEPRVGRAIIDQEWNNSGNSFAEKDDFVERPPGNKFGDMRFGAYSKPVATHPRSQSLESNVTGNPAWKWNEGAPNNQIQSGKRNYESMTSGQSFNSALRENQYLQGEMLPPKRSRFSPVMQNDREALEQYTSMISDQATLSQHNVLFTDDAKFKINASDPFYESPPDWKSSTFPGKWHAVDSSKFARPPHDIRGENVGFRHKPFAGEMKGMVEREVSQVSYPQSRDMRHLPHEPPHSQGSSEPLGRDRYAEHHLQDRASRLPGQRRSPMLNPGSIDQGRPLPSEMQMSSAHYPLNLSPRSYPNSRSHRSPMLVKSPGPGMRGKSPPPFSQGKSLSMASGARDRSPPWRKGKSPPGPGRGRHFGLERERSPPAGGGSYRPPGKGRSPGPGGRGGLSGSSGRLRSPGAPRLSGPPRRDRSPELTRKVKSPGPVGRMRSPGPPRRSLDLEGRDRSPGFVRKERSPGYPERGRPLERGRWKSPERSLDHSGKGKSTGLYGGERSQGSSGRGKSPLHQDKGRLPVSSRGDRSPGPPRGPPSGPQQRGRSPVKSHSGGRGSHGSVERRRPPPESSGRGSSPGIGRPRPSGTSGRARSPVTTGRDRGRSPKSSATSKSSRTSKGKSSGSLPNKSAEYQEPSGSRGPAAGFIAQSRPIKDQGNSSNFPSRGRSSRGKPYGGTGIRSDSCSQGQARPMMNERSPRRINRSSRSPVRRLTNENEYGEYKEKMDRSPYLEEVSLSPRCNRVWSPTRRPVMNVRSHRSRERSQSVDALQRGYSPVSPQSGGYQGGRNLYPQELDIPERGEIMKQDRPLHFYSDRPPLSVDDYASARKSSVELDIKDSQRERFYSPERQVSFGAGRHSAEKTHNTKGKWRKHDKDRGDQHFNGKKAAVGKISDTKDMKKIVSSEFPEVTGGSLLEEDVDDDLRIHLLRLREQKVEMKLIKLDEESKETELKLLELKNNRTAPRGESPVEEERRYPEKEPYHPQGRKQEQPGPWKYQHKPSEPERYHRQKKYF